MQIKTEPISSFIFIQKEDIKTKQELQDFYSNLIDQNLSDMEIDINTSDLANDICLVNTTSFYIIVFLFLKLPINFDLIFKWNRGKYQYCRPYSVGRWAKIQKAKQKKLILIIYLNKKG